MSDTTPDTTTKTETINELLEALAQEPQGVPADPDVFDALFNFIETALSADDLDDVAVVTDDDGFLRPEAGAPFSID